MSTKNGQAVNYAAMTRKADVLRTVCAQTARTYSGITRFRPLTSEELAAQLDAVNASEKYGRVARYLRRRKWRHAK